MSWFGSGVDPQQEDFGAAGSGGRDHTFAESELHLPGL